MPENVLIIEQGYTDIIDLQFIPKDAIKSFFGLSNHQVEQDVTIEGGGQIQERTLDDTNEGSAENFSQMDSLLDRFNINQ